LPLTPSLISLAASVRDRDHQEYAMADTTVVDTAEAPVAAESPVEALVEESLVEEVSIDGMCGVY
jgi:mycofactocin precursor peptide MftA